MSTIHNEAQLDDFAETVLMPGDPLRAKYIAEHYLQDVKQINQLRNMFAYTGHYKGVKVSVMGSGMGIPSISLYAHELFSHYKVNQIIRVGSCGALQSSVRLGDIVLAMGACTDSGVNRQRSVGLDFAAIADFNLLHHASELCKSNEICWHVGNVFSTDSFYSEAQLQRNALINLGVLAAEMEAAGLYGVAAEFGKKALAINTVSDHILEGTLLDSDARQQGFDKMISIALETAIS